jgi:LmbE family N-acetylglucosaminyl deacetylase
MKALLTLVAVATLAPITAAQESPRTILAVFAHSDDEIIVGPLLARYARQGAKIHLV